MTSTATAQKLSERVRSDLATVALGATERVSVGAADRDGRVLLDGVVRSFAHHSAALRTARSVPGVLVVEDHITILI